MLQFNKTSEGSTAKLIQLCIGYFVFYVITGVTVKYFLGKPELGFPGLQGLEFLAYSTLGGTSVCLGWVIIRKWYRFKTHRMITLLGLTFPSEFLYIIPSGICTAVVIPTTTLMYTLPISVMVAMVIMRGSVIVVSRIVDSIQIRRGILKKKVYFEENIAVVFAIFAVAVHLLWAGSGGFEFLSSTAAMTIFCSYIVAYAIRIYIMNYYKNTRKKGVAHNNKGFFAIEQITSSLTLGTIAILILLAPSLFSVNLAQIEIFRTAILEPQPEWMQATLAGMAFGVVAFFSVFIFMFKGRTATFAGLVNRLTSLIAGTTATLIFCVVFDGRFPKMQDWISLGFILVAVSFLTRAERRRAAELAAAKEIENVKTISANREISGQGALA